MTRMKKVRCPGCGLPFKNPQALGNHKNYCQRLKERPAAVQPAAPRVPTPSAEKAISRGKKWDPSWSDAEKERHLLENSAFEWGIERRRRGKWQVVPVPGGMSYSAAVIAADERSTIDRLMPPVRRVRRVEEEEDTEALALGLLLLELMTARV